jgi:sugar diacid utilization regulator/transcriptional regulator with GAF, ATPase, and Fis domain
MPSLDLKALDAVFASHPFQHALYEAARAGRVILKVDASIIFLMDRAAGQLTAAAWHGREAVDTCLSLSSPSIRALWASRRSILWERRERCTDPEICAILDGMGLGCGLIVPILLSGSYIGAWLVASAAPRSFSENDELILQTFCENIGLTTESMLLSEENLRFRREANALYEIGKEISQLMNLDRVLEVIAKKTCSLMGAEMSYIALADPEHQEVRVRVTEGMRGEAMKRMVLKYGEGVGGYVAATRTPLLVDNYPTDPRPKPPGIADLAATEEIISIISVPMFTRAGLVGVLFAASRQEAVFSSSQMDLLTALGTQAAIAIENAHLFEQEKVTSEKLLSASSIHQQLLKLVLGGQGLQAITDTLAEVVQCAVTVEDSLHHLLYASAPSLADSSRQALPILTTADIWNDPALDAQLHILRVARQSVQIPPRPENRIPYARTVAPIVAGSSLFGYVTALECGPGLNDQQRSAIEQASIVMALEFLKQEAAGEVEQRLAGDFLDDLVAGRGVNDTSIYQRASRLNVDLHRPHRILVLDVDRFRQPANHRQWSDMEALTIKRRFLSTVSEIVRRLEGAAVLTGTRSDSLLVLLPSPPPRTLADVQALAVGLIEALHADLPELSISVGIGCIAQEPTQIAKSYADAILALRSAASAGQKGAVVALEELGVLPLLLQSQDQGGLVSFMERQLGPLLSYDEQNQAHLVPTLQAYLANNGNMQRTAAECHVHINSLKYRLQRIQDIAGFDLHHGETRFNLQLALSIYTALKILKG